MNTIAPPPTVTHKPIHFAVEFPVTETACGVLGPAADKWESVTCPECLFVHENPIRVSGFREVK